ncbi:MAG: phage holin family protein [Betaproteobacteria bacterium]
MNLVRSGTSLLRVVQALGRDLYELVRLEADLAASAAVTLAGLGAAILVLVSTGWLLLVLALAAWIADRWLSLPAALLSVGVLMLLIAAPMGFVAMRLTRRLAFPETRRRLDEVMRGH